MQEVITRPRNSLFLFSLLYLSAAVLPSSAASVLTGNLTNTSGGTDIVSGSELLAADFRTDSQAYSLQSAILLLQSDSPGNATLSLYADNSGIPGVLVGALTSPASYSSTLTNTTFTGSGLLLSPDTTYWLVLGASSGGSYEWSWTADNTGTGAGFLADSAYFDGTYWYQTAGIYPYQMSVSAIPSAASAVPEPGTRGLLVLAALSMAFFLSRRSLPLLRRGVQS